MVTFGKSCLGNLVLKADETDTLSFIFSSARLLDFESLNPTATKPDRLKEQNSTFTPDIAELVTFS